MPSIGLLAHVALLCEILTETFLFLAGDLLLWWRLCVASCKKTNNKGPRDRFPLLFLPASSSWRGMMALPAVPFLALQQRCFSLLLLLLLLHIFARRVFCTALGGGQSRASRSTAAVRQERNK